MSKLLKSKFLFGLMMVLAFTVVATSVDAAITTTLKQGSKGAEVSELQTLLKVSPATGYFGSKTKAAVVAFQTSKGLKADGVVGAMTRGALTETPASTTPPTTGALCPNGNLLSNNCAAAGTTPTTPEVSTGTGFLTNVVRTGAVSNAKVREGSNDVQVMSIEVTAKDADQTISGLKLNFTNGSLRFNRGAKEISVWLNDKKLATKEASAWSSDTSGYDYRFTGMNGVVKKDQKAIIYVTVSGLSSFDATDVAGTWTVSAPADAVTATSPSGMYDTYGNSMSTTMTFEKAGSSASDLKYKVSVNSNSPAARANTVSLTSDTSDVTLLSFDVKAENGDMVLQKLPIQLVATDGTADGVAPYVEAIAKSVKLYANGTKIADETIPTGHATEVITFGNTSKLNYTISSNSTVKFEVKVDVNDVESTASQATDFDSGDGLTANYTDVSYNNGNGLTVVELPNGGNYVQNRSGSVSGELQTMRSSGLTTTLSAASTPAPTINTNGALTSAQYTMDLSVTALGDTMYIPRVAGFVAGTDNSATAPTVVPGTNGISFGIIKGDSFYQSAGATGAGHLVTGAYSTSVALVSGGSLDSATGKIKITDGSTAVIRLVVTISETATAGDVAGQYKIGVLSVNGANTSGGALTGYATTPVFSFESPFNTPTFQ